METIGAVLAVLREINAPSLVLLFMLAFALYVAWQAQKRSDFDFADMLRDDGGKPSALRLGTFVCIGVSSWLIVYVALNDRYKDNFDVIFTMYITVLSGAKVAEKWMSMLEARYRAQAGLPQVSQKQRGDTDTDSMAEESQLPTPRSRLPTP